MLHVSYCVRNFKEISRTILLYRRKEVVFLMRLIPYELCTVSDKRGRATLVSAQSNETLSLYIFTKTKLRGLSPRAIYTDRAAAAGRRS